MIADNSYTETKIMVRCLICDTGYDSRVSLSCPKCNYPKLYFTYDIDAVCPMINRRKEAYRVDASKQYQNDVLFKLNELIQLTAKAPTMANMDSAPSYLKTGEMSSALKAVWMQLVEKYESDTEQKGSQNEGSESRLGQSIIMGRYNNQDLKWIILEKKDNKILVISDDVIEWLPFNNRRNKIITWKDCTLRTWLNSDFYLTAFSEKEKKAIEYSVVKNQTIEDKNMDTIDWVFLLSVEDVKMYRNIIPYISMDWHLRDLTSTSFKSNFMMSFFINFRLKWVWTMGDVTESRGVRPAMWLNLDNLMLKQ